MEKRTSRHRVVRGGPNPPAGVIPFLQHWHAAACKARDTHKGIEVPESLADYVSGQERYWDNVASGLMWVIKWAERLDKAKNRKA